MWNLWNSFQSLQSLFLFYQLFLRGPWGSVIGYAQTNPLSSKEAISALLPSCSDPLQWSLSWAPVHGLARGPCQGKSEPVSSFVPMSGTTRPQWLCLWLLSSIWVVDTVQKKKKKKGRPQLSLQLQCWWERHAGAQGVCIPNARGDTMPQFQCNLRHFRFPMSPVSL